MSTRNFFKTPRVPRRFSRSQLAALAIVAGAATAAALPLSASATEYQVIERPSQECWNEQVPVRTGQADPGGAIVGGIAGGILGNQIGRGDGRAVATALGAMTGAVVGDRLSGGVSTVSYQTVRRCRTVIDQAQVPVAYRQVEVIRPAPVVERRVVVIEDEHDHDRYWRWHHEHRHEHEDWDGYRSR